MERIKHSHRSPQSPPQSPTHSYSLCVLCVLCGLIQFLVCRTYRYSEPSLSTLRNSQRDFKINLSTDIHVEDCSMPTPGGDRSFQAKYTTDGK